MEPNADEVLDAVIEWLYRRAQQTEEDPSLEDPAGAAVLRSAADALPAAVGELRALVSASRRSR